MSNKNTGNRNTGYRNTGDRNTGYLNTGNRNTGDRNTGDRNTGNRNTGDRNTGYLNTGYRNTGDRNTGYLNTKTPIEGLVFNKMTNIEDISFPNWFYFDVKSQDGNDCCMRIKEEDMTDKMKEENPEYETTGGYIKVSLIEDDMKVHRRRAFDKCNDLEDMKKTLEIPNFDYDIFEEISGISKKDLDNKLGSGTLVEENKASSDDIIELNGVMYKKI